MIKRHFLYISVLFFSIGAPQLVFGQSNKDRPVVNQNQLDVIYLDQDDDYQGAVIDQRNAPAEPVSPSPNTPMIARPQNDDRPQTPRTFRPDQTSEGVDSEFDILYASMDNEVIHYYSANEIPDSILIHLTDASRGRKFCFPTPSHARLSSHFGARKRRWHYGVDLAMPTGEPIFSAFDGIVRLSKFNSSYGNLVVVRHFNGLETYYAHMSVRDVNSGDTVRAGQVLGLCGNTGRSYGSHLHFEVRYMGKAINPEYLIDCVNHRLYSDDIVLTPAYFRKVGSSHSSPDLAELRRVNRHAGSAANTPATVAQTQPRTATTRPTPPPKKPAKPAAQYYTIKKGDTLGKIAQRHHTTVKKLCQLNGLKENSTLRIGRRIRVR